MELVHLFFSCWYYNPLWVCILQPSSGAIDSSLTRFLDHTQRRVTVGRSPLDEKLVHLVGFIIKRLQIPFSDSARSDSGKFE